MIAARLEAVLDTSGIRANHFGFRTSRGCTDVFAGVLDSVRKKIEEKMKTALLLIDFRGAYNRVDHSLLLFKLQQANVAPAILRFIQFWLDRRTAVYDNKFIRLGGSGLPQGSPLSCALFIFYHDLQLGPTQSNAFMCVYADDTAFVINARSWAEVDQITKRVPRQNRNIKFF